MFDFLADYLFTKEEQPTMANFNARLEMLNALKNHWWKQVKLDYSPVMGSSKGIYLTSSHTSENNISYSDSVDVSSGSVRLSNEKTNIVSSGSASWCNSNLRGKYITNATVSNGSEAAPTSDVFFVQQDATFEIYGGSWLYVDKAMIISVSKTPSTISYVQSSNRNAYPDSGEQDDYEYQYLGVPFENALGAPKIETGNYVGTGTYGEDNPNSLTLGFEAKVLFVYSTASIVGSTSQLSILETDQETFVNIGIGSSGYQNKVVKSDDGKTVSWYAEGSSGRANSQMNTAGAMYNYIAIG